LQAVHRETTEGAAVLERDGYPAGVPCWVDTGQPDPEAAVSFYEGLFGWDFEDRMPADAPGRYFVAQLRGRDVAAVGSQSDQPPPKPVWKTYVWVDSADETTAKAKEAGGTALAEPFEVGDSGRMAVLADPEGAVFCVWQANKHRGAQLVNEPGTWNFSELNTRDPQGAQAFYGAVFGWKATTIVTGDGGFTMFRRPGYGDYLAERDPSLRERMGADHVPEGFEDAVAWLVPMVNGEVPEDTPPHWSITFAVDDADAVAERAERLGGTVLAPPFNAPWVRMTVLSDPQGAVFTASKYMPPG
jgi:predicted enzyme related to lactoylglutathione lyase